MPNLPTTLAQAIAALGLTIPQAARKIGGDMAGYKAALKRLHNCTSDTPPTSLALLEADLEALGLQLTITPKTLKDKNTMTSVFPTAEGYNNIHEARKALAESRIDRDRYKEIWDAAVSGRSKDGDYRFVGNSGLQNPQPGGYAVSNGQR